MSEFIERVDNSVYETESPVKYAVADGIATVTMNRTEFNNAQNSQMTYALDAAFKRAISDDAVKVIVLRGEGKHFSAGHDIGTPGRDINKEFERAHLLWDHSNKPGGEFLYMREQGLLGHVPALARDAQADHRHGPGCLHRRRADAGLGLRPDRGQRRRLLRDPVVRMGIPGWSTSPIPTR